MQAIIRTSDLQMMRLMRNKNLMGFENPLGLVCRPPSFQGGHKSAMVAMPGPAEI